MERHKIGVIGAGPSGSILAAHLAARGEDVTVIDILADRLKDIEENKLRICGERELAAAVKGTCNSIEQLKDDPQDILFLATKATALPAVVKALKRAWHPNTTIVAFQNGIDNEELVCEEFGRDNTVRVVINFAGFMLDDGRVKMTFFHPPNYIGGCSEKSGAKARMIGVMMSEASLTTEHTDDIKRYEWKKTLLNAALMPISALTGQTMLQIMTLPETRMLVERLLNEGIEVAKGMGYDYGDDFFKTGIEYLEGAGHHKPSMCFDVEAGRRTEIDYLNGKIVEYGHGMGLAVPANTGITQLIKGAENSATQRLNS